jgi:hypothetical protein
MMREYPGSCHCGRVRFSVSAPESVELERCNCSICSKSGYLELIVPRSRFELLSGEADLSTYTFNTGVARHTFCRHCGIKPFYVPRSNPDGVAVNFNCLDEKPPGVEIVDFDGQNWEANAAALAHKSREG